jgi:arylsulfatase A-like enzyme
MSTDRISTVILISIDNLRADCISANPDKSALADYNLDHYTETPILDNLVSKGTFFPNCYSASSYTTASHASILTGLYPAQHGVQEYYRNAISRDVQTIFDIFKRAGYVTLLATDFPFLIGPNLGFTRSVEHFIKEDDEQVLKYFNMHQDEKLFAFVHFGSVHNPFGLSSLKIDGEYFVQQVAQLGEKMGVPEMFRLEEEWIEHSRSTRERLMRQRYFRCTDLMYQQCRYNELMNLYSRGIEYFDRHRFRLFIEQMVELCKNDSTVLVVTADHGEEYSKRAFAHYNGLWEGIVNVPLIIIGPGIPGQKIQQSICRTVDIVPTLLDLAGINKDKSNFDLDGMSLAPGLYKDPLSAKGETWFGYTEQIRNFMKLCQKAGKLLQVRSLANTRLEYMRKDEWKFILRSDFSKKQEESYLFHMKDDRLEKNNLAAQQPDIVKIMKEEVISGRRQSRVEEFHVEGEELEDLALNLKDIGYLKERRIL